MGGQRCPTADVGELTVVQTADTRGSAMGGISPPIVPIGKPPRGRGKIKVEKSLKVGCPTLSQNVTEGYSSCSDLYDQNVTRCDGIYAIGLKGKSVYCDMTDGKGGWTVGGVTAFGLHRVETVSVSVGCR